MNEIENFKQKIQVFEKNEKKLQEEINSLNNIILQNQIENDQLQNILNTKKKKEEFLNEEIKKFSKLKLKKIDENTYENKNIKFIDVIPNKKSIKNVSQVFNYLVTII